VGVPLAGGLHVSFNPLLRRLASARGRRDSRAPILDPRALWVAMRAQESGRGQPGAKVGELVETPPHGYTGLNNALDCTVALSVDTAPVATAFPSAEQVLAETQHHPTKSTDIPETRHPHTPRPCRTEAPRCTR
jgi:hypothetical protein